LVVLGEVVQWDTATKRVFLIEDLRYGFVSTHRLVIHSCVSLCGVGVAVVRLAMTNTLRKFPLSMTVADFLAWPGDGTGRKFQLVDGEVRAMSPASAAHAIIRANLAAEIRRHLREQKVRCRVGTEPGVLTRVRASISVRVPDVGVTCTRLAPGQQAWPDPILLIEILSPGNATDTWENVWSYCTIPSVREIAIVHSARVLVELLRRGPDGDWPEETEKIGHDGVLAFESIGFNCPLAEVYTDTPLSDEDAT
jgi:Uma2 family endonuclease